MLIDEAGSESALENSSTLLYNSVTVSGVVPANGYAGMSDLVLHSAIATGMHVTLLLASQVQKSASFDVSVRQRCKRLKALFQSVASSVATILCSSAVAFLGDEGAFSSAWDGFLSGFAECRARPCMTLRWGPFENQVSMHGVRFEGINRTEAVPFLELASRAGHGSSISVMKLDWEDLKRTRFLARKPISSSAEGGSDLDDTVARWAKKLLRTEGKNFEDSQQQLEDAKLLEQQLKGIALELEDVGKQAKIRQMKQTVLKFMSLHLGLRPDTDVVNAPLVELGLDSLTLVTLSEAVRDEFSVACEDFFFFEFGSLLRAAKELAKRIVDDASEQRPFESFSLSFLAASALPPLGLAGFSFRFPGARSQKEFWANQLGKVSAIQQFRPLGYNGPSNELRFGGLCEWMSCFDNGFFRISPLEASVMDPQHRVVLEETWNAIENAGMTPNLLASTGVSVFCGVSKNDYAELMRENMGAINPFVSTGTVHSLVSNRISYFFNFLGQSVSIDTACSSSLVAISNALQGCTKKKDVCCCF